MIKQMKDQHESEKNVQREEYLRAFNRLKEEMTMLRSGSKGKEDELEFYKKDMESMSSENMLLQNKIKEL